MSDNNVTKTYDVVIIGGGPAGLSAAIYAGRSGLSALMIERGVLGGQIFQTSVLENYPGGTMGESGAEFVQRMSEQAEKFGYTKVTDDVKDIKSDGDLRIVVGAKDEYKGRSVIIATGTYPVQLGIPGENEFVGRGVSYCATCDGPFFSGLEVFVVGGGDSAVEEALHLAKFAKKVTIIHRRDELRAAKSIQKKALNTPNVSFMLDTVVREIKGDDLVRSITVANVRTQEVKEIHADEKDGTFGVFVFVGLKPNTQLFKKIVETEDDYIVTDETMKTNIDKIYAAGDVRKKTLRQVVTATSDGAIAAVSISKQLMAE